MLGQGSTTELHPKPFLLFILSQGLAKLQASLEFMQQIRQALILSLPDSWDDKPPPQAWHKMRYLYSDNLILWLFSGTPYSASSVGAESKLKPEKRMGKATLPSPRHTHLLLGVLALRLEGGRDDDLCEAELCLFGLCWAHFSGEQPVLNEGSVCPGFTNSVSEKHKKIRQTWFPPSALSQLSPYKALH